MKELPSHVDVVVVGAGPTGLSLAIALRNSGLSPLLLEKRSDTTNTSRAGVIHARTLEMLEPLGVTPFLLEQGIRVPTFKVRDHDRVLIATDFSRLDTAYPFTLMCPQDRTERILRDHLTAIGGTIVRGAEVVDVEEADDASIVTVRTPGGTRRVVAKWMVGCDGAHSTIRRTAGIVFAGGEYEQTFALADVRMEWPLSRDEVSLFLSADGLMVVGPLPDDRFRIVATADEAPEHPDAAFMTPVLAARGPAGMRHIHEVLWSSRFTVVHRLAERIVKGRTILCGDAAHVHSPAGGQGMNTGIQDAVSLAEPLLRAVRGQNSSDLAAWARTRQKIAADVVATTDRITRVATMRSGPGRRLRNMVLTVAAHIPSVPDRIAAKLAQLDRR